MFREINQSLSIPKTSLNVRYIEGEKYSYFNDSFITKLIGYSRC